MSKYRMCGEDVIDGHTPSRWSELAGEVIDPVPDGEELEDCIYDPTPDTEANIDYKRITMVIISSIKSKRDRAIVTDIMINEMHQNEVAKKYGLSNARVRQVLMRCMRNCRSVKRLRMAAGSCLWYGSRTAA